MRTGRLPVLLAALLGLADCAWATCQEHTRDPGFVLLEVPEGAPRPADANAFAFIDAATTLPTVVAKVGPPDAATGSGATSFWIWCLPDGTEVRISSHDGTTIDDVRHAGKVLFKRKKKK